MADPICRWRNTTPETVKLLVSLLPKVEMPEDGFKHEVRQNCASKKFDADKFFTTAYQLAVQIGLYYVDAKGIYHPRFDRDLSDLEAAEYVSRVAALYVSPNPYAKSMELSGSVACLYDLFVQCAGRLHEGAAINVKKELEDYYHLPIGNTDMVVNLMVASGAFKKVDGQHITYKGFADIAKDKEHFFNHFGGLLGQCENKCGHRIVEKDLLRVGDIFSGKDDGTFTVLEVLPRIYRIRANKTGRIRSVPKAVVASWHRFYKEHSFIDYDEKQKDGSIVHYKKVPIADASARHIRDQYLKSSTEDDPFEHGYYGMLGSVARWLIEQHREEEATSYLISSDGSGESLPVEELKHSIRDLLPIALRLFKKEREESDKHYKYADLAREWFKDYTPQKLKDDFATFQKDLLWSGLVRAQVTKDYAHVDRLADLLDGLKKDPHPLAYYLADEFKSRMAECPGIGIGTIVDMLMKMHPGEYCAYTDMMISSLKMLGMLPADASTKLNSENYRRAMGLYEEIRQRMMQMGIMRTGGECKDAPDFLTVNSFLWFVKENIDLIKEKVMEKKMKTSAPTKFTGSRKQLEFRPDSKEDELLLRLLAALRAKSFAILAGHSGTGKSRYVKKLAYMTCNADELRTEGQLPGNYLLLQVKPNWHDSTDLLGFRNAMDDSKYQKTALIEFLFRAYHFKDTPFFLCLDEMNLAPVEQYFAEFLSAMESKEPVPLNDITADRDAGNLFELGCEWADALDFLKANKFSIPKNLFIVGTVNMDETTNQFSRKVLDRAFTIEMTDVDFKSFNAVEEPSYKDTIEEEKIVALLTGEKSVAALDPDDIADGSALVKVQKALEPTAFAIAYRFANEYTLLKRAIKCFDASDTVKLDALDQAVLMKILPRVAGEKDYIKKVYGESEDKGLRGALKGKEKSLKKIADIMKRADDMNASYVTFWP